MLLHFFLKECSRDCAYYHAILNEKYVSSNEFITKHIFLVSRPTRTSKEMNLSNPPSSTSLRLYYCLSIFELIINQDIDFISTRSLQSLKIDKTHFPPNCLFSDRIHLRFVFLFAVEHFIIYHWLSLRVYIILENVLI